MYGVGMYGGTFNPLHLGHVNCIIQASAQCEELFVVLCHSDNPEEIPYQERFRWLTQLTRDMENVIVVAVKDNSYNKENYNWELGKKDIVDAIERKIDIVFAGSDYIDRGIFERLYPEAKKQFFSRNEINISSTEIRRNPTKHFDYIAKPAQPYFVKKIVVVGSESCGKSTLVRNLAKYYNTVCVEEVGRDVCEFAGGIDNMIPSDFSEIMHRHKVAELDAVKKANRYLFIDTEAIVTQYYLELLFNVDDVYYEDQLATFIASLNRYDLVLFLEPDVEWVQDGTRTYGDDKVRAINSTTLWKMIKDYYPKAICIEGDYLERFEEAVYYTNWLGFNRGV